MKYAQRRGDQRVRAVVRHSAQRVLRRERVGDSQSLSLLTYFNLWNKDTCTDSNGSPTGRCCNDCIKPSKHKLIAYTGLKGLKACSADVEGLLLGSKTVLASSFMELRVCASMDMHPTAVGSLSVLAES